MANPNRNAAVARGLQDTEQDIELVETFNPQPSEVEECNPCEYLTAHSSVRNSIEWELVRQQNPQPLEIQTG